MSEDEFDFAGENPAAHLAVDETATPFDYEAQLRQKGHTKASPLDMGGLFKALASPYMPKRVVHLAPKVVTRVQLREFFPASIVELLLNFFGFVIVLGFYLGIVGGIGIARPYMTLASFEVKTHLQPGAICIITSTHVESYDTIDSGINYDPIVNFTLLTPDGRSFQTSEYWTGSYSTQADAQQYLSKFQLNQSYQCWYDSTNPANASFFKGEVGFWDYFWLPACAILFLVCGVLPNLLLLYHIGQFISSLASGNIKVEF